MILRVFLNLFPACVLALLAGGCAVHHTPPGTSVEIALAKKAELVKLPAPAVAAAPARSIPAVEPALPQPDHTALVADAYSRGQFCMQTGKDDEAISAFQEAVRLDPKFADAWTSLAMLYEKNGQGEQAVEAFRKAKTLAQH
jgi:tetratricopeptide (TPR) repeat protein